MSKPTRLISVVAAVIWASIRFRFILVALAVGLVILGVGQLPRMHTDVLPETAPVVVRIQTEALGLSAPEVEALVTVPLEKNLLEGVMGVTGVTSESVPGLSDIDLHFAPGTGLYTARQLVQERLTGAFVLPNVSKPPVMLPPVSSTGDVMIVGLSSSKLSLVDLSVLARWTIVPRLLGVAGVAGVATYGQADRQLQVQVDPARLAAHHVGLDQVIETAGDAQLVSPLSYLEASTPGTGGFLEGPSQRITIRHVLPFGTPANLAKVPLAGITGRPVSLGSVARVVEGHQPLIGAGLVHGRPGLVLVIQKLPSASVPAVTRGLDHALAYLRPGLPGVRVDASVFRPAAYLDSALSNLRLALAIAGVLAALALLALLAGARLAFIALAAVALSLIAAAGLLYLLGYTFNALGTLGLLLALAVVVDEAAGSARSLMTRLRESRGAGTGVSAARVVAAAVLDFRGPLCSAMVAIALTAAPLVFASGLTAAFLRPMAMAFVLAVAVSMVVALVMTPALAAVLFAAGRREPRAPALATRLAGLHRGLLGRALRLPRWALPALLIAGIAGLALLPAMHPRQPAFEDRDLVIRWAGAPGMSVTEIDRLAARATRELLALPGVQDVAASLGRAVSSDQITGTNSAEIWVAIKPDADYDRAAAQVRAIAVGTPGVEGALSTCETDSMAGVLGGQPDTVVVRIYGPGYPELARLAGQVKTIMSRAGGLRSPRAQLPVVQPTLDVRVNLDQATRYGVKPGDIRREAATLIAGLTVGNFFEQQKAFDVVVMGAPAVRGSVSSVQNMLVDTVNDGHVRLGDLAKISVSAEPAVIRHQATSRYVDVSAQVSGPNASSARAALADQISRMKFPEQYYATVGRGPGAIPGAPLRLAGYALAALIGVYLLAQGAFGSWRLALLLLAVLPLPVAAGAGTAYAIGARGSLAGAVALLAVLAIAIRQAFRVIDGIRSRRGVDGDAPAGVLATAAAARAAGPILASAVVTAAVLLPFVVMGNAPGNELLHPAATVILAGLIVATLVNLVLLPVACLRHGPRAPLPGAGEEEAPGPAWVPAPSGPPGVSNEEDAAHA
jgi:Cu/Ag efflux pump CusA